MSAQSWRYALASVVGTSHTRDGLPCQDVSACRTLTTVEGQAILVAVVADGAGSATHSAAGAELACAMFMDEMVTLFAGGGQIESINHSFIADWLTHFQHAVAERAEAIDSRAREFACTLLAAIVGEDAGAFLQVGDGAIVVSGPREPDEYGWIFWPQRGEYENVTVFATDPGAADHLECEVVLRRYDEVALFTDGIQRLALHLASQTVHRRLATSSVTPTCTCDGSKTGRGEPQCWSPRAISGAPSGLFSCHADCTPTSHIIRRGVSTALFF